MTGKKIFPLATKEHYIYSEDLDIYYLDSKKFPFFPSDHQFTRDPETSAPLYNIDLQEYLKKKPDNRKERLEKIMKRYPFNKRFTIIRQISKNERDIEDTKSGNITIFLLGLYLMYVF